MTDHTFAVRSTDGIWLHGQVDDYPFWAKVCDEASGFGIDCGRVIKLYIISKRTSQEIATYERGWDKRPQDTHKGLTEAVIHFCEPLPVQEVWKDTFLSERRFLITEDDVLEYE